MDDIEARIAALEATIRGLVLMMLKQGGRTAAWVSRSPELAPYLPKDGD